MTARFGQLIGVSGGGGGSPTSLVAAGDAVSTAEDTPLSGNVLTNDTTESGSLSVLEYRVTTPGADYASVYQPGQTATIGALGSIVLNEDGSYTFTPATDYSGSIPNIRYTVTNGSEIRTAVLAITVTAANDPPTAGNAAALSFNGEAVTLDIVDFVSDPDPGASITLTHLNGTAVVLNDVVSITNGTYEWVGGTEVEITPTDENVGTVELTYTVSDGTASDSGNILVQVGVENTPLFSPISPLLGNPLDDAVINFGKTFRKKWGPTDDNGTNVAVPPYSAGQGYFATDPVYNSPTDREPWLYDRATTMWLLAKRTQDAEILEEAMQLARGYMAGVQIAGNGNATFNIIGSTGGDPTDVKYLYGVVAWWYEKETLAAGGTTNQAQVYRTRAQGLYQQTLQSFTQHYNAGNAELWTERNAWASITNCLAWYWISGSTAALGDATNYVEDILTLSEATGAPLHSKDKHESDGDPTQIVSPWMSALLAEAMLQYHRTTDSVGLSKSIPEWLSDYGDWLISNAFYTAAGLDEPELAGLAGLRIPAYLAGTGVQFPEGEEPDMAHCKDVAELMRKVKWAKEELSLSTTAVDTLIAELEEAEEVHMAYWTRATVGYPRYRVNPPRKYAWLNRCRYSYVHSVGIVPFPPSLTTAPVASGSTQQGSTLSVTTGVWAGTPAPTYSYQWRRDGVNIGGATSNTYVTQEADVDTDVDCVVTATNDGGSASSDSNNIAVVVAGSPEITLHPDNASALVGETAVFTVAATGTPSPTYQWQVSTNGGGTWNNVAEGTGGTTDTYTTETLASDDDGDQYRCVVTNAGGSVNSDPATLTMVVQQEAIRFATESGYAILTYSFGEQGFVDFTIAGWFYLENTVNSASWVKAVGVAGRTAYLQYSSGGTPTIGDSQTGTTGGDWGANPPPLNEWIFMTFRGVTTHPGTFSATWQAEDGGSGGTTIYTASRANGIESSVQVQSVQLNGGGDNNGMTMRAQYVRGYDRRLSDQEVLDERTNNTMDVANLVFYNVFEDDGGGGVTVRDASGNNRTFTLTNGTLSVDGPVAATVP